jgi:crotonobetainyl-CoA:carnitine CoA-transferase CaiB-like acyl-CoA transferase
VDRPLENTDTAGPAILDGLRVLDLTDERGAFCGRMFAELGADVIKVEPIGGCQTRRIDPFVDGVPGPDRSAYFIAYQAGKRSITLNLDRDDGCRALADLAATADFVVESSGRAYFDERGIGYNALSEINPALIYTTITPFGERGPAAQWAAADITLWAAGGMMYLTGLPGRPPLQISVPQAHLHAGAEAATASMLAYFARLADGQGQRVVVDTQACVVWTLMNEQAFPLLHGDYLTRSGVMVGAGDLTRRLIFDVADGQVAALLLGESARLLVEWMAEEGAAPPWLQAVDWTTFAPSRLMDAESGLLELMRRSDAAIEAWLQTKTKSFLYEGAIERRILLAPVSTVEDIFEDEQLAARDYFRTFYHPGAGRDLTLPGGFVKYSDVPGVTLRPAPRLGEHNLEVYVHLLGYSLDRVRHMYSTGVI